MKGMFTITRGVIALLHAGIEKRSDAGYEFMLSGDLHQMSAQKIFLESRGVDVGQVGSYPALRSEDEYIEAVRLIWEKRVNGWWHYEKVITKQLKLCGKEEFRK